MNHNEMTAMDQLGNTAYQHQNLFTQSPMKDQQLMNMSQKNTTQTQQQLLTSFQASAKHQSQYNTASFQQPSSGIPYSNAQAAFTMPANSQNSMQLHPFTNDQAHKTKMRRPHSAKRSNFTQNSLILQKNVYNHQTTNGHDLNSMNIRVCTPRQGTRRKNKNRNIITTDTRPRTDFQSSNVFKKVGSNKAIHSSIQPVIPTFHHYGDDHHRKKLIPAKVNLKKEELYEQTIQTKITLNQRNDENTKMRTRISILEQQIQEKDRIIESVIKCQNMPQTYAQQFSGGNNFQSGSLCIDRNIQVNIKLKRQLTDLKKTLFDRDAEISDLKKHIKITKLSQYQVELDTFKKECIRLRAMAENTVAIQINEENAKLREIKQQFQAQMDAKINQFQSVLYQTQNECQKYQNAYNQSIQDINQLQNEKQTCEQQIAAHEETIANLEQQQQKLNEFIKEQQNEYKLLKLSDEDKEDRLGQLDIQNKQLHSKLKEVIEKHQIQISKISKQNQKICEEKDLLISDLEREKEELSKEFEQTQAALDQSQQDNQQLQQNLDSLQSELSQKQEEIQDKYQQIQDKNQEIQDKQGIIDDKTNQIQELQQEFNDEKDRLNQALKDEQGQNQQQQTQIDNLKQDLVDKQTQMDQLQDDLAEERVKYSGLEQKLQHVQEQNTSQQSQIQEQHSNELKDRQKLIDELKFTISELENELEALKKTAGSFSGKLKLTVISAELTRDTEAFGKMDPYCNIIYKKNHMKTEVQQNAGKKPIWNENFELNLECLGDEINFQVMDQETMKNDDEVGNALVNSSLFQVPGGLTEWFDLLYKGKFAGKIQIRGEFYSDGSTMPLQKSFKEAEQKEKELVEIVTKDQASVIMGLQAVKRLCQIHRVLHDKIENLLFGENYKFQSKVSIKQLRNVIVDKLQMKEQDALYFARHLIEPEQNEKIEFDNERSVIACHIITRLMNRVGSFRIFSEEKDNKMKMIFGEKLPSEQIKSKLNTSIKHVKHDLVLIHDFEHCLRECNIELVTDTIECSFICLLRLSNKVHGFKKEMFLEFVDQCSQSAIQRTRTGLQFPSEVELEYSNSQDGDDQDYTNNRAEETVNKQIDFILSDASKLDNTNVRNEILKEQVAAQQQQKVDEVEEDVDDSFEGDERADDDESNDQQQQQVQDKQEELTEPNQNQSNKDSFDAFERDEDQSELAVVPPLNNRQVDNQQIEYQNQYSDPVEMPWKQDQKQDKLNDSFNVNDERSETVDENNKHSQSRLDSQYTEDEPDLMPPSQVAANSMVQAIEQREKEKQAEEEEKKQLEQSQKNQINNYNTSGFILEEDSFEANDDREDEINSKRTEENKNNQVQKVDNGPQETTFQPENISTQNNKTENLNEDSTLQRDKSQDSQIKQEVKNSMPSFFNPTIASPVRSNFFDPTSNSPFSKSKSYMEIRNSSPLNEIREEGQPPSSPQFQQYLHVPEKQLEAVPFEPEEFSKDPLPELYPPKERSDFSNSQDARSYEHWKMSIRSGDATQNALLNHQNLFNKQFSPLPLNSNGSNQNSSTNLPDLSKKPVGKLQPLSLEPINQTKNTAELVNQNNQQDKEIVNNQELQKKETQDHEFVVEENNTGDKLAVEYKSEQEDEEYNDDFNDTQQRQYYQEEDEEDYEF